MPDLWDTNPDNVFRPPDEPPNPPPSDHHDHTQEIPRKEHSSRPRLPAYVLIALVIALVAITVSIVAVAVGLN